MDEAGSDEEVDECSKIEHLNAVDRQLSSIVANHRDLEVVASFEVADQLDHLRVGLGLGEHEVLELLR